MKKNSFQISYKFIKITIDHNRIFNQTFAHSLISYYNALTLISIFRDAAINK